MVFDLDNFFLSVHYRILETHTRPAANIVIIYRINSIPLVSFKGPINGQSNNGFFFWRL